ncbi:c-type cytochrome [Pleurocapsales cyanobacterium LEGE 10410]|nr:c-type cytochrome [Pleurocapsales cyanobacterium LEGE 10410]
MQKLVKIFLISLVVLVVATNAPVFADSVTNLDLERGAAVFEANCAGCHVGGGNIVRRRKNLKLKALQRNQMDTQEAIVSIVTYGKGVMSAYGDKLSPQQISDVSAYVLQKAEQNWK